MRDRDIAQVRQRLQEAGAVAAADGIEVRVHTVRVEPGELAGQQDLVIDYAVAPLPDGTARQPLPRSHDLETYCREVAVEVTAWATEHVRRYRPLPLPDRDEVRRDLPGRDELWRMMRAELVDVREVDGGLAGREAPDASPVTVVVTPEQWQEYVVDCEIGCRRDHGVDASKTGDGPDAALFYLEEMVASRQSDEPYVVFDGREFCRSVRAELPPVRGTASARKAREIEEKHPGGRWTVS